MRPSRLWVPTGVALLGLATLSAQERAFELHFPKPTAINAVKAWGERICAIGFDDYQLRCFDRGGNLKLSVDIRERLSGRTGPLTRIVDYTILDDSGVAVVGNWLGAVSQPEPNLSSYLLVLDSQGNRVALHDLVDLEPRALGGSIDSGLEVLGLDLMFASACDPASGLPVSKNGPPAGALIHPIGPGGEELTSRFLFDAPTNDQEFSQLRKALSKGIAIDSFGNRFFWLSDDELVVAPATGERKSVFLPLQPRLFRTPLRVFPRHGGGALAVFLEGENKATPREAALGFFELTDPEYRVYAIDSTGQVDELSIPGSPELVGELADGTLVGLQGAGQGRGTWAVVFLAPITQLHPRPKASSRSKPSP